MRAALDGGINFLDNCWDYNEGASEIRMGKALRDGYRDKAFLMTKIDGRSKQEAVKQLDESLKRFNIECIDHSGRSMRQLTHNCNSSLLHLFPVFINIRENF